jgi:Prokaryotic Cytochrome C oxidase subunit IV
MRHRHGAAPTTTYAWIILSAITILSWWPAPVIPEAPRPSPVHRSVALILLGFIKGRMIIRYFMEVRTAVAQAISPPRGSPLCGPEFSRSTYTKDS